MKKFSYKLIHYWNLDHNCKSLKKFKLYTRTRYVYIIINNMRLPIAVEVVIHETTEAILHQILEEASVKSLH